MTKNFKKLGSRICLNDFFFTFESLFCILSLSGLRKKTNSFYMSKTSVRSANLESYAFYFFLFIANLDFFFFLRINLESGKLHLCCLCNFFFFLKKLDVIALFFFFGLKTSLLTYSNINIYILTNIQFFVFQIFGVIIQTPKKKILYR